MQLLLRWIPVLACIIVQQLLEVNAARLKSDNQVLNICMDGKHHLNQPTREELYGVCKPWSSNTCCKNETAYHTQQPFSFLYNLNLNHCGNLSENCLRRFYLSHCFYECTPNVGPWVKSTRSSIRNERFFHVPICKSDCDGWWNDCKNDLTCVDNFATGFVWKNKTNHCPANNTCQSFEKWFHNSTNFCQTVYPDDFIVVQNSSIPCMKFEFNGTNPNAKVARIYAEKKGLNLGIKTSPSSPSTTPRHDNKETVQPYFPPTKTPILQQTGTIISIVLISLLVGGILIGFLLYKCKDAIITRKRAGEGYLPSFAWFNRATTNRRATNRTETVDHRPFLQAGEEDDDCAINPHGTLEIDL